MAMGPKRNEGGTVVDERPGSRCTVRYVRASAYKARIVLDTMRGLPVEDAISLLQFTERGIAEVIRKAVLSAVANAENNDNQSRDELFVLACYADEGPTLKRFTPRARGRAGKILKRTCHITIVVARMSDEQLERRRRAAERARGAGRTQTAAASRRERVARSRQAAAGETGTAAAAEAVDETPVAAVADVPTEAADAPYGEGSAAPLADGSMPEGFPIKGNADSMLYHVPDSRYYEQTVAEAWFATEEAAEAAGFSKPGSKKEADAEAADADTAADANEEQA
jgi:large subunit ribosomal protein L22